jgi:hypothetical protein
MLQRSARVAAAVLAVLPVLVLAVVTAAHAQAGSIIPPQVSTYLCQNWQSLKTLTPVIALLVFGASLVFGLIRRHSNLVVDLIVGGLIALVIMNLPTILSNIGLAGGCS